MVAKASGHTAEYIINDMPYAHAIQWQAFYLLSRGCKLTYPDYVMIESERIEEEKILNA